MNIKLYVEGGGGSNALRTECRRAFAKLFEQSGFRGHMPRIVACGSREDAFDHFKTALGASNGDYEPMLLVDSEAPVTAGTAWAHLRERDDWEKPQAASDEQVHLMVECMEAWFLADPEALRAFFGKGFNPNALPGSTSPETIEKEALFKSLKKASRKCIRDKRYAKALSFTILAALSPQKIWCACPHAKRLIEALRAKLLP